MIYFGDVTNSEFTLDYDHLEKVLQSAVKLKPSKILIVVEGLYSMEGEILSLKKGNL